MAEGGEEKGSGKGRGRGEGKKLETFWNNCSRKILYQCVVWGKEVFSFLQLLISDPLFTSFYKLESLCSSKAARQIASQPGIKLLCCQ
jgi:hypothetical protein